MDYIPVQLLRTNFLKHFDISTVWFAKNHRDNLVLLRKGFSYLREQLRNTWTFFFSKAIVLALHDPSKPKPLNLRDWRSLMAHSGALVCPGTATEVFSIFTHFSEAKRLWVPCPWTLLLYGLFCLYTVLCYVVSQFTTKKILLHKLKLFYKAQQEQQPILENPKPLVFMQNGFDPSLEASVSCQKELACYLVSEPPPKFCNNSF